MREIQIMDGWNFPEYLMFVGEANIQNVRILLTKTQYV